MSKRGARKSVPPDGQYTDSEAITSVNRTSLRDSMPTLTDDSEAPSTERTKPVPPSVRPPLAGDALPLDVEAYLEPLRGLDGRSRSLTTVRTTIGRGAKADVKVRDLRASRLHASIFYTGREFRIRDEGSMNGTRLNGSRVVEYGLRDGDDVRVGDTLLRFRLRE
jgi:hypothetical protein